MRLKINSLFVIYAIWIGLVLITTISTFSFNLGNNSKSLTQLFTQWDGGHYIGIAENGYRFLFQYAFLPLFPTILKIGSFIFPNIFFVSLLINGVLSFLIIQVFYKLIKFDFGKIKQLTLPIILLFIFPSSFFLLLPYAESLFLFLSLLAFYLMRQKRFLLSSIVISLACLTRSAGILLLVPLLIELQNTQKKSLFEKGFILLIALLGVSGYGLFLYFSTGSFFALLSAEYYWQRHLTTPIQTFQTFFEIITKTPESTIFWGYLFDFSVFVFGLGIALRSFRFLPKSYAVFALISVLFPIFTNSLVSFPRFLLTIFPLFITLGMIKNRFVLSLYGLVSISLLIVCLSLFIQGYWVS